MAKRVINPQARWTDKPKARPVHKQRNFQVIAQLDENVRFAIYQRQNIADKNDFSCGIAYLPPQAPRLTLARYNGPSHEHGNIFYRTHIHRASEKAIVKGRKPESQAEETDRFQTLEGALACLIDDFNISGLKARQDTPKLWP